MSLWESLTPAMVRAERRDRSKEHVTRRSGPDNRGLVNRAHGEELRVF